jgi:hypothetical protein
MDAFRLESTSVDIPRVFVAKIRYFRAFQEFCCFDHAAVGAIGRSVPQVAGSDMKRDQCQSHRCPRIPSKRIPVSPCFLAFQEFCYFDFPELGI